MTDQGFSSPTLAPKSPIEPSCPLVRVPGFPYCGVSDTVTLLTSDWLPSIKSEALQDGGLASTLVWLDWTMEPNTRDGTTPMAAISSLRTILIFPPSYSQFPFNIP